MPYSNICLQDKVLGGGGGSGWGLKVGVGGGDTRPQGCQVNRTDVCVVINRNEGSSYYQSNVAALSTSVTTWNVRWLASSVHRPLVVWRLHKLLITPPLGTHWWPWGPIIDKLKFIMPVGNWSAVESGEYYYYLGRPWNAVCTWRKRWHKSKSRYVILWWLIDTMSLLTYLTDSDYHWSCK